MDVRVLTVRLFDAHCHLQDAALAPRLDRLLAAARADGVTGWSCCGVREDDWDAVLDIARRHEGVVPSFGLHPAYLRDRRAGWQDRLAGRLTGHPAAGVGEVGLDRAKEGLLPLEDQEAVLREQVALARDLGRPVTIHGVRAWSRVIEILRPFGPHRAGIVCHAFGGPADLVGPLAALNARFSFGGTVTRTHARRIHDAARAVPLDRLLVETDAPDLAPIGEHGLERGPDGRPVNEPRTLRVVVATLAAVRQEAPEVTAEATAENARALFAKAFSS
ncbi:MAG: TatD family hydrolase [Deltaproteobacteria bacterium]|nr:TatD family hydrolase [Deltaproteobacteria bacterium]